MTHCCLIVIEKRKTVPAKEFEIKEKTEARAMIERESERREMADLLVLTRPAESLPERRRL